MLARIQKLARGTIFLCCVIMGNVLDHPKATGDTLSDDLKWLSTQNSSLFNDTYVAGVYDTLPPFAGTDIPVCTVRKYWIRM